VDVIIKQNRGFKMMGLKNKTCCFTGHRKIPSECYEDIVQRLNTLLVQLIQEGYEYFGAGGALGFDTLAAQTVIKLRNQYPQVKLILVLPCRSQADRWSAQDKLIYDEIKNQADKIVFTSEEYTKGCMFKRNRHLVDNSSLCICYLTENTGGTAYTVQYATTKGLVIKNVAEK